MDARVFTEPQQGASYETLLAAAQATAAAGFDGFFRSDHVLKMGSVDGLPGPTDAWVTLAGLARETEGISLGTLVSPGTFRYPGLLAIEVAQVSDMSGGRVELGLGAGWYEAEHTAYGLPFWSLGERFERLEEQLAVVTGLWDTPAGGTFSYSGRHYQLVDSPALPKPARRPRVIVGGRGRNRTPRLAATYADEFNQGFVDLPRFAEPTRPGADGVRRGRTGPGEPAPLRRAGRRARRRRRDGGSGAPRRSAGRSASSGRTGCAARPGRSWTRSPRSPTPAPSASTCRSSTWTTSTTSPSGAPRSSPPCPGSSDGAVPGTAPEGYGAVPGTAPEGYGAVPGTAPEGYGAVLRREPRHHPVVAFELVDEAVVEPERPSLPELVAARAEDVAAPVLGATHLAALVRGVERVEATLQPVPVGDRAALVARQGGQLALAGPGGEVGVGLLGGGAAGRPR